ncbi:arrestin domain-containing protein 2-like [Chironomus tepperi]|uniref:arrestin domain-containing protein 2-like n=1 Tax=Chironomus tepperi TaxID=113505 RepID=UPI00391F20CE
MHCNLHFVNSFSNFVNRKRICSPGDNVKVTIDLHFKQATKVDEVSLHLIGIAKNKFMKQRPGSTGKLLTGSIELINKKIEVVKNADFTTGMHKFRSSFLLPKNLPSSFKFENNATSKLTRWKKTGCTIKYKIQVSVQRPNSPTKKYEYPIELVRLLDLNEVVPSLNKPREVKTTSANGISKDFVMTAVIPQRGYCSGEDITLKLLVDNGSTVHVKGIDILLVQKIILASIINKEPLEKEEEEWAITEATEECEEVPAGEKREFIKVIKVPPLHPDIDNCDLIQVCYRIWIRVKTNEIGKRETLIIPIIIGSVELKKPEVSKPGESTGKKTKLTLNLNNTDQSLKHNSNVCTCTCSCAHCSRIKIVTVSDLGSPDGSCAPVSPDIPQTPLSPSVMNFDTAPAIMITSITPEGVEEEAK